MKTEIKERIANENVRITAENVQHVGECIALSAIKKMMRFAHHPRSLDKLYAGLVEDIYGNRGYNTTFSDGWGASARWSRRFSASSRPTALFCWMRPSPARAPLKALFWPPTCWPPCPLTVYTRFTAPICMS